LRQTFTVTRTPEQNGVVERYWRSLMGPLLAFMFSAKLDKRLWTYCASFVNEVILNKLRIITYKGKVTTSYFVITQEKPNISYLRTWGCECYALDTRRYDPRHFTEKSFKGYFVGYDRLSNSSLVFDPLNDEIIMTNHIKYVEIVNGIRDINNISIVNLNFQSIKPNQYNKLEDKFYCDPIAYWDSEDDDDNELPDQSQFLPENGNSIGRNNAFNTFNGKGFIDKENYKKKHSKRTRDIYEDGKINFIEDIFSLIFNLYVVIPRRVFYAEGSPSVHSGLRQEILRRRKRSSG